MTMEVVAIIPESAPPTTTTAVTAPKTEDVIVTSSAAAEKISSFREETNFSSDLKDFEKKALADFKSKLEEAILSNTLFQAEKPKNEKKKTTKTEQPVKEEGKEEEEENKDKDKAEAATVAAEDETKEESEADTKAEQAVAVDEAVKSEADNKAEEALEKVAIDEAVESEADNKAEQSVEEVAAEVVVDSEISLWGVPLLPSKGGEATEVVLLKFLRARDFNSGEAFEMLRKTLLWRKENGIDSILDEDLGDDLAAAFYTDGVDREGHPVCYNVYSVFQNRELYSKAFGMDAEKKDGNNGKQFLRWRIQQLERSIQKLELKPGGVTSLLQISDLKNSPPPSKKELRVAMNQAVGILQDNYPELVARNILINVPFWYYAMNALLSPFLTQRTRSKFVLARPAKVTDTLLRYISVEEIPAKYGGFKRENDYEFGDSEVVSEAFVKAGSTESIEIPVPEAGGTLLWDVTVVGWEVRYKEEFVPADAGSYTVIIRKEKKMSAGEEAIRNTFRNNEGGKVVLTVENCSSKKKRVLYRYKTKKTA